MANYNFKLNLSVFLVYAGQRYALDYNEDINVSQTFTEETVNKKTLHFPNNNFDGYSITKAAPANFSFTIPLLVESQSIIVLDLLTTTTNYNMNSFDLYIQTDTETYKAETCVIEEGIFNLTEQDIITIDISGSASRFYRVGNQNYNIPGSGHSDRKVTTRTYRLLKYMKVAVNSVTLDYITGVTFGIQNKITWTDRATVQDSLAVTAASNTIYPKTFTLTGRILSGSIDQNVTNSSNTAPQTWGAVPISIDAVVKLDIPSAVFTNRYDISGGATDIITQTYDFRMITNPSALSSVLTY